MDTLSPLKIALTNSNTVKGYTHNFYRYPARFSPIFAREVINCFTNPGDIVLDPFVGGGTSIVEAMALGRKSIGIDVSALAIFISKAKTTLLSDSDIVKINNWKKNIYLTKSIRNNESAAFWKKEGYLKNLNEKDTWRIRNYIENLLERINCFNCPDVKIFLRCSILKTGQWALDGKKNIPNLDRFRSKLDSTIDEMICATQGLLDAIYKRNNKFYYPKLIHRSSIGIETENIFYNSKPKLILMSPPYPGVHIIYHRWQIKGRKETPAPFWIADQLDGHGGSHYTFGNRLTHGKEKYFNEMKKVFISLAEVCSPKTTLVQLVAFSEPKEHFPRYLSIMESSGFEEINNNARVWRKVPNRKWYADLKGDNPSSNEVMLIHRFHE